MAEQKEKTNRHSSRGRHVADLGRMFIRSGAIASYVTAFALPNIFAAIVPCGQMLLAPIWRAIFTPIEKKSQPYARTGRQLISIPHSDAGTSSALERNGKTRRHRRNTQPIWLYWNPDLQASSAYAYRGKNPKVAIGRQASVPCVEIANNLLLNLSPAESRATLHHEIGHHETGMSRLYLRLGAWEFAAREITLRFTLPVALARSALARWTSVEQAGNLYEKVSSLPLMDYVIPTATQFRHGARLVTDLANKILGQPDDGLFYAVLSGAVLCGVAVGMSALGRRAERAADIYAVRRDNRNVDGLVDLLMRFHTGNDPQTEVPMRYVLRDAPSRGEGWLLSRHPHVFKRIRTIYREAEKLGVKPALTEDDVWRPKPPFPSIENAKMKFE